MARAEERGAAELQHRDQHAEGIGPAGGEREYHAYGSRAEEMPKKTGLVAHQWRPDAVIVDSVIAYNIRAYAYAAPGAATAPGPSATNR